MNFVLKNEASKANFDLNKRMLIQKPFLHWVCKEGGREGRREEGAKVSAIWPKGIQKGPEMGKMKERKGSRDNKKERETKKIGIWKKGKRRKEGKRGEGKEGKIAGRREVNIN